MNKLTEIFKEKERTFSLELFPPKTEKGYEKLLDTISLLSELKPDFISCTYGAGGSNRGRTLDIAQHIQDKHNIIAVAHLTCVCHTKDELKSILEEIKKRNIQNVLALRGDPPQDNPGWTPGEDNFKYSSELVAFMREHFKDYFGIGVAGFPEGHPLSPDKETDADLLKVKIDAGADYIATQLFFDNKDYFDYVARLKKRGVTARIIPGILPITNYNSLLKFCEVCGASVPQKIHDLFKPIADDSEKTLQVGIEFAVSQCQELLQKKAPGFHFYCLNKLNPVKEIINQIRKQ